jgi:hypothetical protein
VYYGSFKTAEEANAVAKPIRLKANGEFDISRRPEMFIEAPSDLATVIDTDKAVKGRWYCPRVGRLSVCKQLGERGSGREFGVYAGRGTYYVQIERKTYGTYTSAAEANVVAHKIMDELWGDNGRVAFDPWELGQRVNVYVGRQMRRLDDLAPIGKHLVEVMGVDPDLAQEILMAALFEGHMFAGLGGYSRCSTAVWAAVGQPLLDGSGSWRLRRP